MMVSLTVMIKAQDTQCLLSLTSQLKNISLNARRRQTMTNINLERLTRTHNGTRGKRETDTPEYSTWTLEIFSGNQIVIRTENGNYKTTFSELMNAIDSEMRQ